jgi:hypothetical protein
MIFQDKHSVNKIHFIQVSLSEEPKPDLSPKQKRAIEFVVKRGHLLEVGFWKPNGLCRCAYFWDEKKYPFATAKKLPTILT